ncbi:hypothetical protein [Arcobacter sp.]|uniref:hypothetical protein n=1 Tax=Arcobacter sp. TaxID=1872629 RepID=UPI003C753A20
MFFKSLIFSLIAIFFTSCASSSFYYDKKDSSANINLLNVNKKIVLTNPKIEHTFSQCTINSYTLKDDNKKYGNLFLENIQLSTDCHWNGSVTGFFTYELKTRMKFKSFELVDRFSKDYYEISTYKVNNEKYVSIIDMYTVNSDVLIIDNNGKLSQEIIKILDPEFNFKYVNAPRTDINYNYSLVKFNMFNSYFTKESERRIRGN